MEWTKIWQQRANGWAHSEIVSANTPASEPIEPDSAYVYIWLESMRITNVRKGLTRFFGAVHSFVNVPVLSGAERATFHSVSTPTGLQALDSEHLDRVEVMHKRLLGPVPWRGGVLSLDIGLFSIKEADLAVPFISLLQTLSEAGGVSFVKSALPFAEPIRKGIGLITGANGDCLEIGISREFRELKTGTFALMRADAAVVDTGKWSVDSSCRLMSEQKSVEGSAYLVYRIEAVKRRDDFYAIPDIFKAYDALNEGLRQGADDNRIGELFSTFRRTVMTSPELLYRDAERLVAEVETRIAKISGQTKKAYRSKAAPPPLPPLDRIPL